MIWSIYKDGGPTYKVIQLILFFFRLLGKNLEKVIIALN